MPLLSAPVRMGYFLSIPRAFGACKYEPLALDRSATTPGSVFRDTRGLPSRSDYMLRFLVLALLLLASGAAQAQSITLSGFVRDADTRETLIGASVYAPGEQRGAVTNVYGFFSLTLPRTPEADSSDVLVISYVGYEPLALRLDRTEDQEFDVALVPEADVLGTAVVTADRAERADETTRMGT